MFLSQKLTKQRQDSKRQSLLYDELNSFDESINNSQKTTELSVNNKCLFFQLLQKFGIMLAIYWTLAGLLVVLSAFLICYYADPKAALYAKLLVFLSFLASLICFVILPIDIYETSVQNQERIEAVKSAWVIIYYINFFLCWFVLPFAQEYQDSGEFTFAKKIKQSFIMNGILIGVLCGGAIVVVILLLIVSQFTIGQLPGVFATLVNIFGLTLVSIFMGYGLLSFPKQCFQRRDYKTMVTLCHRQAESIKSEQQNILQQIFTIRQILDRQHNRNVQQKNQVLALINQNFKFQNYRGDECQTAKQLSKKSTADLHKIIKKRILQKNANCSRLDQLVDDLKQITESYLDNSYSRKKICYTVIFLISVIISALVFFAEVSTFATFLAPINVLKFMGWGGQTAYFFNVFLTIYVAYIVGNSIFRLKVYKVFALYKGHSSASSLFFTAINLSRVCYPLCFNYLQIISTPDSSFLNFFGQVTIPSQYAIIFPILMIVFALFNAFDIYDRVVGYLGLTSYAFDDEQARQMREEGRSILVERFKERNLQNNLLQMIQLL